MIEIKEVKNKRDISIFAKYPVILYKGCPYYVPSLRSDEKATFNPKKNFSLKNNKIKAFLAYKDGKLVGRIAGLINYKDNELQKKNMVRFSRFECINDIEVFKALLKAVANFGKENGMDIMHGPWGFNDTDREGMLTFGFNERSTYATNYYYPYFAENMVKLGFEDESKWLEKRFRIPKEVDKRMLSLAERLKTRLNVVDVTEEMPLKKIIKKYGLSLFDTLNDAYKDLDGYVPIEGKAIENVLKQFATIINPRYISILVDEKDTVAAFGICLPSIADALIKSRGKLLPTGFIGVLKSKFFTRDLEMALIGVRSDYKNTGINSLIITKILQRIIDNKIENLESNPMLEYNYNIQQQWKFVDADVVKKRQTYIKDIDYVLNEM